MTLCVFLLHARYYALKSLLSHYTQQRAGGDIVRSQQRCITERCKGAKYRHDLILLIIIRFIRWHDQSKGKVTQTRSNITDNRVKQGTTKLKGKARHDQA
jgi:hypothetical protein